MDVIDVELVHYKFLQIEDFQIAKREEDIGFYAGFVADRYGRRPVMIFGSVSKADFPMFQCHPLIKFSLVYASEVCRKEYQSMGMSMVNTSWGIGLVIGPSLGADIIACREVSNLIFKRISFREVSLLVTLSFGINLGIGCNCCLLLGPVQNLRGQSNNMKTGTVQKETLHFHTRSDEESEDSCNAPVASTYAVDMRGSLQRYEEKSRDSQQRLLKNWPLMSSIITYCVLHLHDMAYTEIFSLWAISPRRHGGLSYSGAEVGEVLAISAMLSGLTLALLINCASLLKNLLSVSACPNCEVLLSSSVMGMVIVDF
ncbi:hypothetical protein FEM48_Zijuj07G0150900 [Ziziphus jujuba var. spinosa]|uniref:Uncharacterized protein n=1 Tax=Ziziphus jujuba var. spinosa TaxID=714518 RepID=A0A978V5C1_ZIZJJ|nr:hypothetical protein FEM48_Zijuj07G0150900 [Ziziphus jujuba var. spinosa]